jgi:hypothetical protein
MIDMKIGCILIGLAAKAQAELYKRQIENISSNTFGKRTNKDDEILELIRRAAETRKTRGGKYTGFADNTKKERRLAYDDDDDDDADQDVCLKGVDNNNCASRGPIIADHSARAKTARRRYSIQQETISDKEQQTKG